MEIVMYKIPKRIFEFPGNYNVNLSTTLFNSQLLTMKYMKTNIIIKCNMFV